MRSSYDVAIVGAGIIGLATGMKLLEAFPGLRVVILEKENMPAAHQSGHNSGVIHSGIYYRPGSLKAGLCLAGYRELIDFCAKHGVRFEICGKVVIAVREEQLSALNELHRRGMENGVPGLRIISPSEVKEIEPFARCIRGLHVPTTGIVDFRKVAVAYSDVFEQKGGEVRLGSRVGRIAGGASVVRISTLGDEISANLIINCAAFIRTVSPRCRGSGLHAGSVPFRGEYYSIKPERRYLVKHLIYPVPDPRFPFLGVHFTRMIDGKIEAGPNAVLAFGREGYHRWSIAPLELLETLGYAGFWRLVSRYWENGIGEMARSFSKTLFARALRQSKTRRCAWWSIRRRLHHQPVRQKGWVRDAGERRVRQRAPKP